MLLKMSDSNDGNDDDDDGDDYDDNDLNNDNDHDTSRCCTILATAGATVRTT